MSVAGTLRPVGSLARFLASGLLLTCALRMVIVALSAGGSTPAQAPTSSAAPLTGGSAGPDGASAPGEPGKPIKMRISVDVKPDRADVYVDGVLRGRVPYFGDVTCVEGTPFVVEVRPKGAAVRRFERTCKAGTTRIE